MVSEEVDIFVSQLLTIHLFDTVYQHSAIQTDETLLWKFADKRCDILVFNVRIGVKLRTSGSILRYTIVCEEFYFLNCFAVFCVLLAIYNEALCHLIEALFHQSFLNLILYILNFDVVMYVKVR